MIVAGLAYGAHRGWNYYKSLKAQISGLQTDLASTKGDLARTEKDNADLIDALQAEQAKNANYESQFRDLSGTVGQLQKLSQTDPELLRKYSKVYFLNENYLPASLTAIDTRYLYDKKSPEKFLTPALPFLNDLLQAAERDGVSLGVASAYRSFADQAALNYDYKMTYGARVANQFSAAQGYSEHQLGTAVDFATASSTVFVNFQKTAAYAWLSNNAYKYGFILSYPESNSYYRFEPWHWRFAGVALATTLHDRGMHFYDMDQREINQYLISLFDRAR